MAVHVSKQSGYIVTVETRNATVETTYRVRVKANHAAEALLRAGDLIMVNVGDDIISQVDVETGDLGEVV